MDNYESRVDGLDAPGDMGHAQEALELTYDLRGSAMTEIADTDQHRAGRRRRRESDGGDRPADAEAAGRDVVYATVVRPEINRVLADNGIEGDDVPESVFLPDETKWLDESHGLLGARLGQRRRRRNLRRARPRPARHQPQRDRTGRRRDHRRRRAKKRRKSKSKSRTRANRPRTASPSRSPSNGSASVDQTISSIGAGETQSVAIPLVPAPTGTATLEVEVQPVPGEQVTSNNEATYTVEFE